MLSSLGGCKQMSGRRSNSRMALCSSFVHDPGHTFWREAMTIWISQLLGPVILALSVPMIVAPAGLQETTRRFLADSPLVLISGVLAMTAGLSIVNTHNVWVLGWPLVVTLFGWALVIGGASRIIAPGAVGRVGKTMTDRPMMTRVAGVIWAALGAFLTFKGYA
jgi:hypothetical protein